MSNIIPYSSYFSQTRTDGSAGTLADALAKATKLPAPTEAGTAAQDDTVTLSAEAQALLDSYLQQASGTQSDETTESFALTPKQQQQLRDILNRYKDAPFTEETLAKIKENIEDAGLGPEQLAAKELIQTINPTNTLLNILSGFDTSFTNEAQSTTATQEAAQKKSQKYVEDIIGYWQSISTTAGVEAS